MKKILAILALCSFCLNSLAQKANTLINVSGQEINSNNYQEIIRQMDAYWEANPNKDIKGSGYKPYQRWKEYWKYYLNQDGTLMTSQQIAEQFVNARKNPSTKKPLVFAKTTAKDESDWKPVGPYSHTNKGSWSPGQGRINITTIDPSDPNTIYVGTPNGGLWRSKNHGNSWEVLTDFLPSIGVSGIAIDPTNSNIIYISTGDEDGSDSYTNGVYKTIDGGATWKQLSYPFTAYSLSGEILINPNDPNMLWIVGNNGLYKSTDAGLTWSRKISILCKEIRLKPKNPNTLYVVQKNSTTTSILKSVDAGETFSTIDTFLNSGRTMIDVTPADSQYLYVLVAKSNNTYRGIWRSTDGGASFTAQNTTTTNVFGSTQAYYDLALAVSPTDKNMIFTGCMDIWKSTNGGTTLTKVNSWSKPDTATYTHADIHDLKFFNNKLYCGSDGGIYISDNNGASFTDKTINGLNISQFYRIDVAQSDSVQIVGGLQDNGGYSYVNSAWKVYHGADGMDAAIDPSNPNIHYGFIQFGGSLYYHNITDTAKGKYIANDPAGESGDWITPLEFGNGGVLYAGYKKLYALFVDTFLSVSKLTLSANIKQIRVDPKNDFHVLFSNGNKLYKSDGTSAFNIDSLTTLPLISITNFDFNRNNPAIIYAIGDVGVYQSDDTGNTWKNITYGLAPGAKNAIIHQASSTNNTLYLATNKAVYYTNDSLKEWQLYSNNIPNTTITDIEVNNVENHVVISTYGRGIWRSPVVPEALTIEIPDQDRSNIILFPNPVQSTTRINVTINEPSVLKVYSIDGKNIITQEYNRIDPQTIFDFSGLTSGTYIMTISSETHLITKKFLKN
ncbi:MAG: T9SS type A sorting domain-containing protein [Bacteroidota bacterium]